MFVSDLKANWFDYKVPHDFVNMLPDTCRVCGAPTEISEILTGLHCSNPRCPDKVCMRIKAMCKELGILGFGENTIAEFVDEYCVTNPLNIFNLREGMPICDRLSQESSDKIIEQITRVKDFQLWEYVQIAQLPYIQTSAKAIFGGYTNLSTAYKDIEMGGVAFIQEKLGIQANDEVSIRATQIYLSLMEFKDDLYECLTDVRFVTLGDKTEVNIYCSDKAGGGYKHKKDFYADIESMFGSKFHFNIASVNTKLNYLIWAGADGTPCEVTSKVSKVMGYQQKGHDIPIMTADQFISHMKGRM